MTVVSAAGTVRLAADLALTRIGFGTIQLAGPMAWGPPEDPDEAGRVLHAVVQLGITHIDTSDIYGPHTVHDLIRDTLYPYPPGLHLVTKVGATRGPDRSWPPALGRDELIRAVHEDLGRLNLPALDLVHLRMTGSLEPDDIVEPFTVLAELQQQGLIRHLGVSNVSADQVAMARKIAPVVSVQNAYNLAWRGDDDLVDQCAQDGTAFVPFFPVRGLQAAQTRVLDGIAHDLGVSRTRVALAWLLYRSPTILLIPGTSRLAHLRDNAAAGELVLPEAALRKLDALGTSRRGVPWEH